MMVQKMKKLTQKGFTLLEMLVVLFIISLLLLLFIPNVGNNQDKAEKTGDEAFRQVLQTQVDLIKMEGNTPTNFNDLGLTPRQIERAEKFVIEGGVVKKVGEQ